MNDFKVFHQSLLLILRFDFNLLARLSKYDFYDRSSVVVSFLSCAVRIWWPIKCTNKKLFTMQTNFQLDTF